MSDPAWSDHRVVELVIEDLLAALNETFEQTGGFSPVDLPAPIEADGYTVVAWEYRGKERLNHLARKEFLAGRHDVVVRGITVVTTSDQEPRFTGTSTGRGSTNSSAWCRAVRASGSCRRRGSALTRTSTPCSCRRRSRSSAGELNKQRVVGGEVVLERVAALAIKPRIRVPRTRPRGRSWATSRGPEARGRSRTWRLPRSPHPSARARREPARASRGTCTTSGRTPTARAIARMQPSTLVISLPATL